MWRLSAAIGGVNFYETFGDRWDYEAYDWAGENIYDDLNNTNNIQLLKYLELYY